MLSASIVFFRERTALKPFAKAQELELCKMLVTSSESYQTCLTVSVSVPQKHLLNNLRKSWIHIKVTTLVSGNIWLWGLHLQGYVVSCWGENLIPYSQSLDPKSCQSVQMFVPMELWLLKGQQEASEWDIGAERKETGVTGA